MVVWKKAKSAPRTRAAVRAEVLACHKLGWSSVSISRHLRVPERSVRDMVKRWRGRDVTLERPRTGRPTKVTPKIQKLLVETLRDPTVGTLRGTAALLRDQGVKIGRTTVSKVAHDCGLRAVVP